MSKKITAFALLFLPFLLTIYFKIVIQFILLMFPNVHDVGLVAFTLVLITIAVMAFVMMTWYEETRR